MTRPMTSLFALIALPILLSGCETEPLAGPVEANIQSLYDHYLSKCANCHAPSAPGKKSNTEKTLDFTSADTAKQTLLTGAASGLQGNFESCNGAPFVVAGKPGQSLVLAALDASARNTFDNPSVPDCDGDTIAPMDIRAGGAPSAAWLTAFKQWITDGATQ